MRAKRKAMTVSTTASPGRTAEFDALLSPQRCAVMAPSRKPILPTLAGDLAGEAERWLGIPVIAINVATYWSALRANGIEDRIRGFGSLLAEH